MYLLTFLLTLLTLPSHASDLIVRTSHAGEVEHLLYLEERGLLFTGATDGSVRVWDSEKQQLLRSIQVSQLPIRSLAAHPSRPEIAVLIRTTEGYRLSVWDYEKREELYFEELQSEPLHINYSPQGTWLIYSRTAAQSVVTINSETGERENRIGTGTGIVGYFTIGSSEANVMSYAPANGRIQYTRFRDGEVLQSASTITNLQNMQVLTNRRYAAARHGNDLVIVDILNGDEVARTRRRQIRDIKVDASSDRFAVLHGTAGRRGVDIYSFSNGSLNLHEEISSSDASQTAGIEYIRENIFTGGPDGRLALLNTDATLDVFATNVLRPIRSVALGEYSMLIAAENFTNTIRSDFFGADSLDEEDSNRRIETGSLSGDEELHRREGTFEATDPAGRSITLSERFGRRGSSFTSRSALRRISPEVELSRSDAFGRDRSPDPIAGLGETEITISYLSENRWNDPLSHAPNLFTTIDNRILLWDTTDIPVSWSALSGPAEPIPGSPSGRVRSLVAHDAAVSLLYEDGRVEQRHPITFDLLQEREVSGAHTAAFIRENMLLVGRNASGLSGSALIRLDPATGETVNLETDAFYVFRMAVDRRRGAVYVLGLSRSQNGVETILERITGDGLRETQRLLEVPAEDLNADVVVDSRTGAVYLAAGLDGIIVWDGEVRSLPPTDHLARRLSVARGKIIAVNANGTLSIWNQATEHHLGDIYLFNDERWLAVGADNGGFFTDEEMEVADLLRQSDGNDEVSDERITLPVTFQVAAGRDGVTVDEVFRALGTR